MTNAGKIKKLTALLLAMIMVITVWPCAIADSKYVHADENSGDQTVTFTEVTAEDVYRALGVYAEDEKKADVTVTGDVSLDTDYGNVISVSTEQNSEASVTIQGGVTGDSDWSITGVGLYGSGKDSIIVNKDLKVTGTESANGVYVDMNGYTSELVYDTNGYNGELVENELDSTYYNGEKTICVYYNKTDKYYYNDQGEKWSYKIIPTGAIGTATINGNVSAVSSDGEATAVNILYSGDATVIINDNASATGESATGVNSVNYWGNDYTSEKHVSIAGDLTVNATDGKATGIYQAGNQNGEVNIQGKVDVTGTSGAVGVSGSTSEDGSQIIKIGKDLVVNGGSGSTTGLTVSGTGDVNASIGGKVSTISEGKITTYDYGDGYSYSYHGDDYGISSQSNQNNVNISIGNGVSVITKENNATGVGASGTGKNTVSVNGSVIVEGTSADGISASSAGYYTRYERNPETGNYEEKYFEADGKTTVTATGDVKATATDGAATGISASGSGETEVKGVKDVEVTGTNGATGISTSSAGYYNQGKYDSDTHSYEYTYDLDGKTTVNTTGNVMVNGGSGSTTGIDASGSGNTSVTINGNLQVNSVGGEVEYNGPGGSVYTRRGNDYGIKASSYYETGNTTVTVGGNVDVTSTGNNVTGFDNYGPGNRGDVSTKIGGNLTATTIEGSAKAVSETTNGHESISIGGNVIVAGTDASGINVSAREYESIGGGPGTNSIYKKTDGKANLNAEGDLDVTATNGNASGISTSGTGTTEVKVGGDATVTGIEAKGIYSYAEGEYVTYSYNRETETSTRISFDTTGKATTEVGGDLTVKGQHRADGVEINGSGDNTVIIGGKLTTTSDGYIQTDDYGDGEIYSYKQSDTAVDISLEKGGSSTVKIGEGVEATSIINDVTGVSINADNEEKVSLTIENGGLSVATGEDADADAMTLRNSGGDIEVDVNGDVDSTGSGISIRSTMESTWGKLDFEPNEADLTYESDDGEYKRYYNAEKNVYYDSNGEMWSYVNQGTTSLHVVGDVTVKGEDSSAIYISSADNTRYDYDDEGYTGEVKEDELVYWTKRKDDDGNIITRKTYYNKEGDFYYDDEGNKWSKIVKDANESKTEVLIEGDVTAADTAIMINAPSKTAVVDITVDGTVSGEEHSIVLSNETTSENLMITVWEVKPNAQGNLIERIKGYDYTGEEGKPIYEQDREAEQAIQYIIRIAQPEYISTEGTTSYNGYEVAHEGDIVYVRLNIPAGYEVDQVYMDEGQTVPVLKDEAGNYYLAVPWGGGVLLSLKLKRRQANLTPAVITLDPNGGTIDGSSDPIQVKTYIGKQFILPAAPVREGYTFLGWFGSSFSKEDDQWKEPEAGSEDLLGADTKLKITEKDTFFTAIWAENSSDEDQQGTD